MRALVTGANSLVGCHIVRALLDKKYNVTVLVRVNSDIRSLDGLDVEIVRGDVLKPETLEKACYKRDIIFHAAAIFSYSSFDRNNMNDLALKGTSNIIECGQRKRVKRIVLTSSSVTLGSTNVPQILNELHQVINTNPSNYIQSKLIQEKTALEKASMYGVNLVIVCPTICVGEHDFRLTESNSIFINYLRDPFKSTWPGGCNIVSASDVGKGHVILSEKGVNGKKYILGSENLYWSTIHSTISELCGIDGPRMVASHTTSFLAGTIWEAISLLSGKRPYVTREQAKMVGKFFWYSSSKAKKLGYQPMSSRDALIKAISWLVISEHVTREQRTSMSLSDDIYMMRNKF